MMEKCMLFVILTVGYGCVHGLPTSKNLQTNNQAGLSQPDKLVCYFPNWAQYTPGSGRYTASDVDPFLCTHVIVTFAFIQRTRLIPTESNDYETYATLTNLRIANPNLKVLLAVGGYTMGSEPFDYVTENPIRLASFVQNVIDYLRLHDFDGVDIDWEYPSPQNRDKFTWLLKELREGFARDALMSSTTRLILSASLGATADKLTNNYNLTAIQPYLDFANVMTYDFRGFWGHPPVPVGHHSPLYGHLSVDSTLHWFETFGFPHHKFIMGVPSYGRSFTLCDPLNNQHGDPACAVGEQGFYTKEAGILSYYEVCIRLTLGYTRVFDDEQQVPYAYAGDQWVGYDDKESVTNKVRFAQANNLGGVMFWDLSKDDFNNLCGDGSSPLIRRARLLLSLGGAETTTTTTTTPRTTTTTATTTTTQSSTTTTTPSTTTTLPISTTTIPITTTPDPTTTTTIPTTTTTISTTTTPIPTTTTAIPTTTTAIPTTTTAIPTTTTTIPTTTTTIPTTTTTTRSPTTTTLPPIECQADGQYIRDPEHCDVYYLCDAGVPIRNECPHGLVFDTFLRVCNWPDQVDCSLYPTRSP